MTRLLLLAVALGMLAGCSSEYAGVPVYQRRPGPFAVWWETWALPGFISATVFYCLPVDGDAQCGTCSQLDVSAPWPPNAESATPLLQLRYDGNGGVTAMLTLKPTYSVHPTEAKP